MPRSPLLGRRVHISGSIAGDPRFATAPDVEAARRFVALLVPELVRKGANFVVPVDREPTRDDGQPICFDWLVWEALHASIPRRPTDASGPLAVAVQHYKSEDQVPADKAALWDDLRASPQIEIQNAAHWNMASKRMEMQARAGDILVALGGTEGVLFLANLYHDAGKPVIPLELPITAEHDGARRLFAFALTQSRTDRFFRTVDGLRPHGWINRIRFTSRQPLEERVRTLVELLEALAPPRAFGVRLLDPKHADFPAVEDHFENVVRPVVEQDLGYELAVVDGRAAFERARVDDEIFAKLHRSSVVIADVTGSRPNCFLELGYALGRQLPTMVMGQEGSDLPFDITTISGLRWRLTGTPRERREAFRAHWDAIRTRPPIVSVDSLIL